MAPPKDVTLKDAEGLALIGKPTRRLDVTDKVHGQADLRHRRARARHAHAALAQCPVFKGTLKSVDDTKLAA